MTRDSEAYDAGLRPGDVIVGFNGQTIDDPVAVLRLVADAKIGTTAVVKVLRDGKPRRVQAADRLDLHVAAAPLIRSTAASLTVKNVDNAHEARRAARPRHALLVQEYLIRSR